MVSLLQHLHATLGSPKSTKQHSLSIFPKLNNLGPIDSCSIANLFINGVWNWGAEVYVEMFLPFCAVKFEKGRYKISTTSTKNKITLKDSEVAFRLDKSRYHDVIRILAMQFSFITCVSNPVPLFPFIVPVPEFSPLNKESTILNRAE